jgi:hypothetical protein
VSGQDALGFPKAVSVGRGFELRAAFLRPAAIVIANLRTGPQRVVLRRRPEIYQRERFHRTERLRLFMPSQRPLFAKKT